MAFGVHRALDTAGAVLGPLIAFGLLLLAPQGFDSIFFVSFCFALIGLAILVLFVPRSTRSGRSGPARAGRADHDAFDRAAARSAALRRAARRRRRPRRSMTMSDGFVYLGLQRNLDFAGRNLPLLYVSTRSCTCCSRCRSGGSPTGSGAPRSSSGGYALLLVVYAALMMPGLGLGGIRGRDRRLRRVLRGHGRRARPRSRAHAAARGSRATGLSVVVTVTSIARLVASVVFGAVWMLIGVTAAVGVFAVALVFAAMFAGFVLHRYGREPSVA